MEIEIHGAQNLNCKTSPQSLNDTRIQNGCKRNRLQVFNDSGFWSIRNSKHSKFLSERQSKSGLWRERNTANKKNLLPLKIQTISFYLLNHVTSKFQCGAETIWFKKRKEKEREQQTEQEKDNLCDAKKMPLNVLTKPDPKSKRMQEFLTHLFSTQLQFTPSLC